VRLNQTTLKEMIREALSEVEKDPTKLGTTGTTSSQFKTAGLETAKAVSTDKEVDKVELTYIKQIQDFLTKRAQETDLKKYKMQIQTLIKRLDKIIKPTTPQQGEPQ